MTAPIDSAWSNTVLSDGNLNQTTYGQGTSFPSTWSTSRLFWRTDLKQLYQNTGTEATPSWELLIQSASASSGLLFTHETSGYTSASSISKTQTTGNFNYTDNGYSVVNPANAFDGSGSTYATANSLYNGGEGWTIDFGRIHLGVTINYYASYSHNGYNNGLMMYYSTNGSSWTTVFNGHNSTINTTLWSPDSTVSGVDVRYLKAVASGTNGYVHAQIRKFYLTGTPTGSQLTQTGDYGSTKYMSGVSITPLSPLDFVDDTFTIKTSPNNSTWTLNRTIAKTDLTAGSANYIRMNPVDARYVKLEGDSSGVIEVGSVQSVYDQNDNAHMIKNHSHESIDSTDSTLGLDGSG
jgi:hypothetical protein